MSTATTMLDRITSTHRAEFEAQSAYMQTPPFLGRIALMQRVADLLVADGFEVWPQVCITGNDQKTYAPGIFLHIEINQDHKRAGLRRLHEILPCLIPGDPQYTEGDSSIELCPHAHRITDGWKPAELREAALFDAGN